MKRQFVGWGLVGIALFIHINATGDTISMICGILLLAGIMTVNGRGK